MLFPKLLFFLAGCIGAAYALAGGFCALRSHQKAPGRLEDKQKAAVGALLLTAAELSLMTVLLCTG